MNKRHRTTSKFGRSANPAAHLVLSPLTGVGVVSSLALVLVAASASAATFEERVNRANAAFETEQGEAYEKILRPYVQAAIKKCAPAGSAAKANPGKFVLVADVSVEGKIFNSTITPESNSSICFTREFGAQTLPAPPSSIVSEGFAPLAVEIYIVP